MTATIGKKVIYRFAEGNASMRDLLGGKGANLCEMVHLGLPVPPGFIITTEACLDYFRQGRSLPDSFWSEVHRHVKLLEEEAGKYFGDASNPLLVSVRSGAKFSMPGMMDTILNLGINDQVAMGLARLTGDERFAFDAYRRFLQIFGKVVLHVSAGVFDEILDRAKKKAGVTADSALSARALTEIVERFQTLIERESGQRVPSDPWEQLQAAIQAVFESWNSPRAIAYREYHGIPHDLGTAVNILAMVFGNMGPDSGTGVAFSRDPATGAPELYGEYLPNAQGEDVVSGARTPFTIAQLGQEAPELYQQLEEIADRLERHYRDVQDIEFTVERGKLYILQTRNAKRTARAAVRIAVALSDEGLISPDEAVERVSPEEVEQLLLPQFDPAAKHAAIESRRLLTKGLPASPGAATGKAIFDAARAVAAAEHGERVVLVRPETNPDDVHGILRASGVLTARGGITSHAAVVTRGLGKPCIVGAEALWVEPERHRMSIGDIVVREGEEISIDGTTGEVFLGAITTATANLLEQQELVKLLTWADERRQLGVFANADTPADAALARAYGAEGIGLCRTEHMFFQKDRLPVVRDMLVSAPEATRLDNAVKRLQQALAEAEDTHAADLRAKLHAAEAAYDASAAVNRYREALRRLELFQTDDFTQILEVMNGLPVVIRLLDAPLHEFLPSYEELLSEVVRLEATGGNPEELIEKRELLHIVGKLREANPMLGHRGCRLGLTFPAIYEMQVRAIVTAACRLRQRGCDPHPEIMIPLVSHANELRRLRERLLRVAEEVQQAYNQRVHVPLGTMIETPRGALVAAEIAGAAEFFSFGSNDLTQMSFAFSRDDAEEKFLTDYIESGILPANPFATLDRDGVGRLIRIAAEEGRCTRSDLELGICGEHGGDPSSIHFCHEVGLTYVSCSPFRIPVARLAAAQAALSGRSGAEIDSTA